MLNFFEKAAIKKAFMGRMICLFFKFSTCYFMRKIKLKHLFVNLTDSGPFSD
jgi:hypothetical protein